MSIDATVDALANPSAGHTAAGFPLRRPPAREPVTQTGTVTQSAVSMPVPATDSDLIDAIADRHRDALEVVFVEYGPGLYSLTCRMCGPTLAGEIVETVFVNLWTRPSQFQPDAGLAGRIVAPRTRGMTLLDVGAGLGGASAWAAEHYGVRPIGIDPMVEASRGVARLFDQPAVTATAASLPLRSASVTAAWMLGGLDTLDHRDQALTELRRVLDDTGRVGILAYVASTTVSAGTAPDGNHFQPTGALETALEQAGLVVVDRVEGAQLPGPPLDWQLRQDRLQSELDHLHDGDPRWILAADQERAFARLLDAGTVTVVLLHAICV